VFHLSPCHRAVAIEHSPAWQFYPWWKSWVLEAGLSEDSSMVSPPECYTRSPMGSEHPLSTQKEWLKLKHKLVPVEMGRDSRQRPGVVSRSCFQPWSTRAPQPGHFRTNQVWSQLPQISTSQVA
jgi:hypothetical protein